MNRTPTTVDPTPESMARSLGRIEGTLGGMAEQLDDHNERLQYMERRRVVTWAQFGVVLAAVVGVVKLGVLRVIGQSGP